MNVESFRIETNLLVNVKTMSCPDTDLINKARRVGPGRAVDSNTDARLLYVNTGLGLLICFSLNSKLNKGE